MTKEAPAHGPSHLIVVSDAQCLPAPLRHAAYRWVARHRYRLFGRSDTCLGPGPQDAGRFLD